LYSNLFPEITGQSRFIFTDDLYPAYVYLIEKIYLFFAKIDPWEKIFSKITKKIFRNA
jgi:hypothetical protein